jgi:hypothetical protein
MAAFNDLGLNHTAGRLNGLGRMPRLNENQEEDGQDTNFVDTLMEMISAIQEQEQEETGNNTIFRLPDPVPETIYIPPTQDDVTDSDSTTAADTEIDDSVTTAPLASIADVVFATGNAHTDLLSKINNANTIDERLGYVKELRDKIIQALNSAGYTAATTSNDSADKISVDGKIYDVVRASKGLGRNAKVQLLEVKEGAGTASGSGVVDAIFKAGEQGIGLLRQISTSFNGTERRNLAAQIQQMMADYLNANGYTAETHNSPDKIIINGVTYDYIQGLNAVGQQAQFQALKV